MNKVAGAIGSLVTFGCLDPIVKASVLLVEDDVALAGLLKEYLGKKEFEVAIEVDGLAAVERILGGSFDCVILDITLPGIDGLEVCRRVRDTYFGPVLMLTARGTEADEVLGLETGADDYLAKPMQPLVLVARLRALLRRSRITQHRQDRIEVGSLIIDATARAVSLGDRNIRFTTSEYDLLFLLAQRPGEVLSRAELHEQLRGIAYDGLDRSIDLTVARIRKKLGDTARNAKHIQSVHGVGYRLATDS